MNEGTRITVRELISVLQALPPELPVLVSGYESGYEGFHAPRMIEVVHCPEKAYYDGEYQVPEAKSEGARIEVVVLERVMRK